MDYSKVTRLNDMDQYLEAEVRCDALWESPHAEDQRLLIHLVELLVKFEDEHEQQIREVYGDAAWDETEDTYETKWYHDDPYY